MKFLKYTLYILIPFGIGLSIYFINFQSVFGERKVHIEQDPQVTDDDEEQGQIIKFEIGYGIDVLNIDIIPPNEVAFQENFITEKDVVEFYSEYNIEKNFYFNKKKILDIDSDEIVIKLIPLKVEDVKLVNRFNHEEVNVNFFLRAGLPFEESKKLEKICWDPKIKNMAEIKYEIYKFLNPVYRKEFLDYGIEKMIY